MTENVGALTDNPAIMTENLDSLTEKPAAMTENLRLAIDKPSATADPSIRNGFIILVIHTYLFQAFTADFSHISVDILHFIGDDRRFTADIQRFSTILTAIHRNTRQSEEKDRVFPPCNICLRMIAIFLREIKSPFA